MFKLNGFKVFPITFFRVEFLTCGWNRFGLKGELIASSRAPDALLVFFSGWNWAAVQLR